MFEMCLLLLKNHEKWLETDLIPSPSLNSVLMIHNASYHNSRVTHIPTFYLEKCDEQLIFKSWHSFQ
jgi:hypothetical protein